MKYLGIQISAPTYHALSLVSEIEKDLKPEANWVVDSGAVVDQGSCFNCYAVSYTQVWNGVLSRFMDPEHMKYYAGEDGVIAVEVDPLLAEDRETFLACLPRTPLETNDGQLYY